MRVSLSLEDLSLKAPIEFIVDRPGRFAVGLSGGAIASVALGVAEPHYRPPAAVLLAAALLALVALGIRASGWRDQEGKERASAEALESLAQRRDDALYYRGLSELLSRSFELFDSGQLGGSEECWEVRNRALDTLLELECRRLEHLGIDDVSLIVGRVTEEHYLVRRVAGPLKVKVGRGDRCRLNQDVDDALGRFGRFAIHHWTPCFGHELVLGAVADSPLGITARGELARVASIFQLMYERFRLMEQTAGAEGSGEAGEG